MLNPFLLMAVFYLIVAILAAADAALASFTLLPWYSALPWLRVHFLTLGVLTQASFGVLPLLAAGRRSAAPPPTRWDVWVLLNGGLVLLFAGLPSVNATLITAGGTLVFVAALLLIRALALIDRAAALDRAAAGNRPAAGAGSARFYIAGLVFLLVGILIGAGLWIGWSEPLRIGVPKEAHVHANSWGFASLVLAGLLVDLLPGLAGRPLASRRALDLIFWAMLLGALGLVAGPWLGGMLAVTLPGLVLHIAATVGLLVVAVRALRAAGLFAQAGAWHLVVSYTWILLPVAMAPFVVLGLPGLPGPEIEATAPQALVYGWMGQFLFAALPWFVARWLLRDPQPRLGGSWLSFAAINLGSALIWVSIFVEPYRGLIHGAAYVALSVALLAAILESVRLTRTALQRAEAGARAPAEAGLD